ncbi:MAG: hypothetical protein E7573_00400 [Ruminococcaceae bacterium]|nr:hypothetical protein [Oscillospiraceae bacterium]
MKNNLTKKQIRKILYMLVSIMFFVMLVTFCVAGIVAPDREYSEAENRNLASFPEISVNSLINGSFMADFEDYMSDQFINRDSIVSLKTTISRLLGNTEVNDVYIGKNNRLFEVPTAFNAERVDKTIDAVNNFAASCGIESKHFILVPNAGYIIPEDLPLSLIPENQSDMISYVYKNLASDIITTDAASVLNNYTDRQNLYLKTDHHWTSEAAFITFREFAKNADITFNENDFENIVLSDTFFGTLASSSGVYSQPDSLKAYIPKNIAGKYLVHNYETQSKYSTFFDVSKLSEKNQYEVFFGGNFSRLKISTLNDNGKNMLIFKDSFANCFIPNLIPHFENIVIIDPRYFTEDINDILADMKFTHLLYLYNLNTFLEDTVLSDITINN